MKVAAYILWMIVWAVLAYVGGRIFGEFLLDVYKDTNGTILASEIVILKATPVILAIAAIYIYIRINEDV